MHTRPCLAHVGADARTARPPARRRPCYYGFRSSAAATRQAQSTWSKSWRSHEASHQPQPALPAHPAWEAIPCTPLQASAAAVVGSPFAASTRCAMPASGVCASSCDVPVTPGAQLCCLRIVQAGCDLTRVAAGHWLTSMFCTVHAASRVAPPTARRTTPPTLLMPLAAR